MPPGAGTPYPIREQLKSLSGKEDTPFWRDSGTAYHTVTYGSILDNTAGIGMLIDTF
jgi:hypothetical protein